MDIFRVFQPENLVPQTKVEGVETLQTKWDREHDIKLRENATFGSNVKNNPNKELFFELNVPGIFGRVSFAQQDCSVGCRNQVTFGTTPDYFFSQKLHGGQGQGGRAETAARRGERQGGEGHHEEHHQREE